METFIKIIETSKQKKLFAKQFPRQETGANGQFCHSELVSESTVHYI